MRKTIEESTYVLPGHRDAEKVFEAERLKKWPDYHTVLVQESHDKNVDSIGRFAAKNPYHRLLTGEMTPDERFAYTGRPDMHVFGMRMVDYKERQRQLEELAKSRSVKFRQPASGSFAYSPGENMAAAMSRAAAADPGNDD